MRILVSSCLLLPSHISAEVQVADEKPKALALPRGGFLDRAEEELHEIGFYGSFGPDGDEGGHYETTLPLWDGDLQPAGRR